MLCFVENQTQKQLASMSVQQLGYKPGNIVQEFGWDDDVDENFRADLMDFIDEDLADEDYSSLADGSIIWWRSDDGDADDLSDVLMDATSNLDEGGIIWVLTPSGTRPNHVESRLVEEGAHTAGMKTTSTKRVCPNWLGTRIISRPRN